MKIKADHDKNGVETYECKVLSNGCQTKINLKTYPNNRINMRELNSTSYSRSSLDH